MGTAAPSFSLVDLPPTTAPSQFSCNFLAVSLLYFCCITAVSLLFFLRFSCNFPTVLLLFRYCSFTEYLSTEEPKPEVDNFDKKLDTWKKGNKEGSHTILSTLSNELYDVYCAYKTVHEIWAILKKKYVVEDAGSQKYAIGNFLDFKMIEEKEVYMQVHDYHLLINDLKNEEIILPETFVAGCLIEKLSDSWRDYKNSMKHKRKQMSLEDVIVHIRIEETNRLRDKVDKAKELTSKANVVENQVAHPQPKNKKPYRKTRDNKNPPKANLAEGDDVIAAVVVSQVNMIAEKKEWIIDYGATKHICGDRNSFYEYIPVRNGEECVYLGDSRSTPVMGKGKILLKLTFGKTLSLSNVLHVPNIRYNLVSVYVLGKAGVKVSFKGDKIVMSKNGAFVGKGYCSGELFKLSVLNIIMNENAPSSAYRFMAW
ncbi:uncharacterized protein LOC116113113 [Pistacia vera]|uniref:uncharacterized protein LOC116113113 n=1 Tax=Pistacia vera TaxID=55513 RepID=UPI00126377C7|nr:uncharacterized protein LOC116113113 [Pistacia vera]